jgi:UDP-GlcNAc:undecaprenyl-phosphate GlcNAc-1-phosphate transferase
MLEIFIQSLVLSGALFFVVFKFLKGEFKRWGGAVLIVSFWSMVLMHRELEMTMQLQGLLLGSMGILFFGLWDDWRNLSWKTQAVFQAVLVAILIYFGFSVEYFSGINGEMIRLDWLIWGGVSIMSAGFIFVWLTGIINAINWADGVDASMGSIAVVGGLSLVFVSFLPEVNQPAVAILASIFLGEIVAFLFFNLPPAKVEAGTSGSYFVGFVLAGLAIIAGSKILTMMIVLILPLVDFAWVIIERWRDGQLIFKKDNRHLHYRLRKLGWSDGRIFLSYFVFLGVVLVVYSLLDTREEKILLLVGEICLVVWGRWVYLADPTKL